MEEKSPLILDIGTEAVKAGFLEKTSLYYYERFGVFAEGDFEREVMKKAVLKAATEVQDKAGRKAKYAILGLPADTLKIRTSVHFLERSKSQAAISKKEDKEIRRDIFKKSREKINEDFAREHDMAPCELDFLEETFLENSIDGYSVSHFAGYKGKKTGAVVLSVFSPKKQLQSFDQLFKELKLKILKVAHPGQYLPQLFKDKEEGLFIDVGGQITQVFIIKKGRLAEVFEFYTGSRDFSKALSQKFGMSGEKARALKENYAEGEMTKELQSRVHDIFLEVAGSWFLNLKPKLKNYTSLFSSNVMLFGGGSHIPEIPTILTSLTKQNSPRVLKNPQLINLTLLSYAGQKQKNA